MPFSPLDALMQVAAPSRKVEPTLRNDKPNGFAPTLKQAYQAEAPRTPQPAPAPPSKPKAEETSAQGKQGQSDRPADDAVAAENPDGAIVAAETDQDTESQSDEQDAIEISAEAAAAAGAAQNAKAVEEATVIATEGGEESAAPIEQIDAEGSTDDAQQADAAAASPFEAKLAATVPEEQATAEETKEPVVSTLHSTRQQSQQHEGGAEENSKSSDGAIGLESGESAANAPAVAQVNDEAVKPKPDEQPTAAAPEESDSDSRESSRLETAEAKSDVQAANAKVEAGATSDAAPVAEAAVQADVTASAPVAPAVDAAAGTTETSPRGVAALDRLMAGHSFKNSKETSDPNGMPTIDRARFVQRVEGAMKAAHQRDGKIQVRLSPPDLGSVKIELAVQNGVLSAKLEAETPAARNLLLDSLPALRERLAQQDIRIEKFDVDVRDQGGNAGSGQADERTADQSGDRQNGRPRSTQNRTSTAAIVPAPRGATAASTASGLDIRV